MSRFSGFLRRRRNVILFSLVAVAVLVGVFATATRTSEPDLPTVEVKKGEFVDTLEIRGDIKPFKSIVLTSPMQSGELQIVKLAKNGAMVTPGDLLVQFDGSTLQRTIQEKQSELRQSDAEIEQARAQSRLTEEQNATALMKSRYDIDRARLDVDRGDTVARIENDKAKLTLSDSQQRLRELEEKIKSDRTSAEADVAAKSRKREKALFDLQRAERGLKNLELRAPGAGMVNVLPNYRSGNMFGGGEQEFREGDRAWPGASILELPDLSSVHLEARLDESDRGRLQAGQDAIVRIEAIPGREFKARINDISVLAKIDFTSGWPPPKNFNLNLVLIDVDPKIRPGMTAVARIATERIPDVVLVPSEAIFQQDGAPNVYRLVGSEFVPTRVEVKRRGREQTILASGVEPGDRIATRRPAAEMIRRAN
jgi:HlyD family secretion protein